MAYKPARKSGTLTTTGSVILGLSGETVVVAYLSGTYTGLSGIFEASIDGTNYFTIQVYDIATGKQLTGTTSLSAANKCVFMLVPGLTHVRFRVTALSTGSVVVTLTNTQSVPPSSPITDMEYQTTSGLQNAAVAAGTTGANVAVYVGKGILNKMVVNALGSASLIIYDNASTNSGTILYSTAAAPALALQQDINVPFVNGILARQENGTAPVTLIYTPLA